MAALHWDRDFDGCPGAKQNIHGMANMPGVLTVSYEDGWALGPKSGPKEVTILVTHVERGRNGDPRMLEKRVEIEKGEHYTNQEASAVLNSVARGCREELERQKHVFPVPGKQKTMPR